MKRLVLLFSVVVLASNQVASQLLAPQLVPGFLPNVAPLPLLPQLSVLPPSPYIPTLPPYVNVNPIVDVFAPIVDTQAYNALSCGCQGPAPCGCGSSPCGCGSSPCGCGLSPCGCGLSPCGCGPTLVDCGIPTSVSAPVFSPCGGGVLPTVPYSSYQPCGCGLTTPLLPPLPPVVGCSKYLRQVCTQPPFL